MSGVLSLIILVLDVVAILEVAKRRLPTHKKVLWGLLILIVPGVGLILYYLLGRK